MAKGEENKGENNVEKLRWGALMVPTRGDTLAPPPASAYHMVLHYHVMSHPFFVLFFLTFHYEHFQI